MRQIVGFARAIEKRRCLDWYTDLVKHAQIHGVRTKPFFEVFPQYEEAIESVRGPKNAGSIMDKASAEILAKLEAEYAESQRTANKN